jgi:hypothetical protein
MFTSSISFNVNVVVFTGCCSRIVDIEDISVKRNIKNSVSSLTEANRNTQ